jgi:hypothetical protein
MAGAAAKRRARGSSVHLGTFQMITEGIDEPLRALEDAQFEICSVER